MSYIERIVEDSPTENKLNFPFSLQEMCKIHILFCLEDYSMNAISLLPPNIRRQLLLALPRVDLLHYEGTAIFNNLDLSSELQHARRKLTEAVLGKHFAIQRYLSVDMSKIFYSESGVYYEVSHIAEHVIKAYSSLKPATTCDTSFIYPNRFSSCKDILSTYNPSLSIADLTFLLKYSNIEKAPEELTVDCYDFTKTVYWKEYQEGRDNKMPSLEEKPLLGKRKRQQYDAQEENVLFQNKRDPVIPFLQKFLANVKVLHLGSREHPTESMGELMVTVSYTILYNVITSKQPRLKHLKLYGYPYTMSWITSSVADLLCRLKQNYKDYYTAQHRYSEFKELASPPPPPYLLEEFSILPGEGDNGYAYEYMTESEASEISATVKVIIAYQLQNLKSLTLEGLGDCYNGFECCEIRDRVDDEKFGPRNCYSNKYKDLLLYLIGFIQQPQYHSLCVVSCRCPEAIKLVETFLTTPTTHEQSLNVTGVDYKETDNNEEEEEEEEIVTIEQYKAREERRSVKFTKQMLPKLLTQRDSLTSKVSSQKWLSSCALKSLDLSGSSGMVHAWLFSFPVLKLKQLKIRTQDIVLIPLDTDLQVEHLGFDTSLSSYQPTISQQHLEKFIVSNRELKTFELSWPFSKRIPGLIPALKQCLSKLHDEGRKIEKVTFYHKSYYDDELNIDALITEFQDLFMSNGTSFVLVSPVLQRLFSDIPYEF